MAVSVLQRGVSHTLFASSFLYSLREARLCTRRGTYVGLFHQELIRLPTSTSLNPQDHPSRSATSSIVQTNALSSHQDFRRMASKKQARDAKKQLVNELKAIDILCMRCPDSEGDFCTTTRQIDGPIVFFSPQGSTNVRMEPYYTTCLKDWLFANGIESKFKGDAVSTGFRRLADFSSATLVNAIKGVGIAILVFPEDNPVQREKYAQFRVVADQTLGVPSLVFSEKRMLSIVGNKSNPEDIVRSLVPYMTSNIMKINTRLGNENPRVDALTSLKDTLVLGADLVHPKQSNPLDVPSIACLVGSTDKHFATFYGSARRTAHRLEIIDRESMVSMASERIRAWSNANDKALPSKILYYRDGTGQSQYSDILRTEVAAIREAFLKVQNEPSTAFTSKKTKLKLTGIVVVKRHTTRFYPSNPSCSKLALKENCVPGTVVDSHITSPYYFDFYLQSHTIEKSGKEKCGSAKPTHYFVIEDDNSFSAEALQDITNAFCYNFSHSTSPVSYASPAYLADRLCDRVTLYLKRWYDNEASVMELSDQQRTRGMDDDWVRGNQVKNPWNASFNSKMFWM